jgi:putative phosphoesterase
MAQKWKMSAGRVRIGVLSDTHGWLDPLVVRHFSGVDHIIHAGDVGARGVLEGLGRIAGVTAVAGNVDANEAGIRLPAEAAGEVGGVRFLVAHDQRRILQRHSDPAREGFDLVVSGHTHAAHADWLDGVLYLNPGAAGAPVQGRRSVAIVEVDLDGLDPRIIGIE